MSLEWVDAGGVQAVVFGPDEELADGNTPRGDDSTDVLGVGLGECVVYGTPQEIIQLLSDAALQVNRYAAEHLDGQPERVQHLIGSPEDDDGIPAIGWLQLGGLSIALTRHEDGGKLMVVLENLNEDPLPVDVLDFMADSPRDTLWQGVLE